MSPESLFLQVWAQAIADGADRPGSWDWNARRAKHLEQWAETWRACVELSKHLARAQQFALEATKAGQE